jgi:tetratricopeptide (TPR) repeat protein
MRRALTLLVSCVLVMSVAFSQGSTPDEKKNDAKKLFNEGNALYKSGNYTGAAEKYKSALALDEDYAYYYGLGLCLKNGKQYEEAISALESSIKLKPDFEGSYNAVGGVYLIQGQYDKAIDAFKTALKYSPKLAPARKGITEAYAGKGQQLYDQGKLEQAGDLVDEALQEESDNAKLYLLAARIYNKLEHPEKALDAANQALKLKKGRSKGAEYFEIGIAHKQLKEFAKARTAFNEARKDPVYSRNAQYELDGLKGK